MHNSQSIYFVNKNIYSIKRFLKMRYFFCKTKKKLVEIFEGNNWLKIVYIMLIGDKLENSSRIYVYYKFCL